MTVVRLKGAGLNVLCPLFAHRTLLRVVVDAVLEGRMGSAHADHAECPQAARLSLGCYEIFGGDPEAPGATSLVREVDTPCELLCPSVPAWSKLLSRIHGEHLSDRPMRAFATEGLDIGNLRQLAQAPDGFTIRAFDADLTTQLNTDLIPHGLQAYNDPQHFLTSGVGFGAVQDGLLACAATSYAASQTRVEVAISTHPAFRRRGLAKAVASTLMIHCLEHGIVPEWSAANPHSQALAVQLGYKPGEQIEISYLEAPDQ